MEKSVVATRYYAVEIRGWEQNKYEGMTSRKTIEPGIRVVRCEEGGDIGQIDVKKGL